LTQRLEQRQQQGPSFVNVFDVRWIAAEIRSLNSPSFFHVRKASDERAAADREKDCSAIPSSALDHPDQSRTTQHRPLITEHL
jgi:hypothetical protein